MHTGGGFGASQGIADLFVGKSQKVSHRHRRRLATWKSHQGAGNVVAQFPALQPFVNRTVLRMKRVGIDQSRFPRATTQSRPKHVARAINAYPQNQSPRAWMPRDPCPALPYDRQRFLQGVFGVLGNPCDPPDRPQHLVLDRANQGVIARWCGVQMDTSALTLVAAISDWPRPFNQVTVSEGQSVYRKIAPNVSGGARNTGRSFPSFLSCRTFRGRQACLPHLGKKRSANCSDCPRRMVGVLHGGDQRARILCSRDLFRKVGRS